MEKNSMLADVVFALVWQLVSFQVVVCASRVAKRLFPLCVGAELILHTSVLSIAITLVGLFVVGGFGLLYAWTSICSVGTVALATDWLSTKSWKSGLPEGEEKQPISKLVIVFWFVASSMLLGNVIANGLLRWPSDWDNLMYHIPFIDHWIQNGSLAATQSARWSMPASSELFGLWFAIPFSGDFMIALNNVPIVVVLAASLIVLGRSCGMTGWGSHVCALICLCNQVTVRQSVDASNDLMVAAFFIAGLVYLGKLQESQRGAVLLLGICIGILVGTKYFAIGYGMILIFAIALWFVRSTSPLRKDARIWLGFVSAILMVGGYWFLRNWWMTGNPVFPIGSKEFAERLPYPGIHRTTLLYHLTADALDLVLDSLWKRMGPWHALAFAASPAVFVWICLDRETRIKYYQNGLILGFIGSLGIFVSTPMLVEDQPETMNHLKWGYTTVRYGLSFWTLEFLLLVGFVNALSARKVFLHRIISTGFVLLVLSTQLYWVYVNLENFSVNRTLLWSLAGSVVAGVYFLICLLSSQNFKAGILITSTLLSSCLIGYLSNRWHDGLASHFDRYSNSNVFSTIEITSHRILVLDERSYPFFGSRRQNHVVQPMLFYGVNRVLNDVLENKVDLIATQEELSKKISRYRPSWDTLADDPHFEPILLEKQNNYRLFRRVELQP